MGMPWIRGPPRNGYARERHAFRPRVFRTQQLLGRYSRVADRCNVGVSNQFHERHPRSQEGIAKGTTVDLDLAKSVFKLRVVRWRTRVMATRSGGEGRRPRRDSASTASRVRRLELDRPVRGSANSWV